MDLTKAEFDDVSKPTGKLIAFAGFLAPLLQPLLQHRFVSRLPGIRLGDEIGTILSRARSGAHGEAASLAMEALRRYRDPPPKEFFLTGHDLWWLFMYHAAYSLHELGDLEKRDELVEMAANGVEPFRGFHVAGSFIVFAHWKYEEGDYDRAIEFAKIAAEADETYAEADFRLGRYYLALGGGDATEQLGRAIRKDHRMFFRIANDPLCRQYPHIIQKLKALSADRIVTVGKKQDEEERGASGA